MNRNADRAGLIGDGPGNSLPDPPGGISTEFITPLILEFINGLHQPDIAFLDQVQKLKTAVGIFLGNADHQPQVGFD